MLYVWCVCREKDVKDIKRVEGFHKAFWCDAKAQYRYSEVRLCSVACIKVKDLGCECEGLGPEEMQIKLMSCLVHTEL